MSVLLSIIVPVYNAEKYIRQCMDSLLRQDISSPEYEIICINDGSTDSSRAILDDYASANHNIIVRHIENRGVSAARNLGLDIAIGAYVWFVDADDFIAPNILKGLTDFALSQHSDRVTLTSFSFDNELDAELVSSRLKEGVLKPNVPYKKVMVTRTLYKRSYLTENGIRFLEGVRYGEDGVFNYQTMIHHPQTDDFSALAYFYRRHPASVSNSVNPEAIKRCIEGAKSIFETLVDDYNQKIDRPETRRMLLYWMEAVISEYAALEPDYFYRNYSWEYCLHGIPLFDFELRRKYCQMHRVSRKPDFARVQAFAKKQKKKESRTKQKRARKKLILGFIKHPKRLLKYFRRSR